MANSAQLKGKTKGRCNIAHLPGGKTRNGSAQTPLWNRLDMIAIDGAIARQAIVGRQVHLAGNAANSGRYRRYRHLPQAGDDRVSRQYQYRPALARGCKTIPADLASTHYSVFQASSPQAWSDSGMPNSCGLGGFSRYPAICRCSSSLSSNCFNACRKASLANAERVVPRRLTRASICSTRSSSIVICMVRMGIVTPISTTMIITITVGVAFAKTAAHTLTGFPDTDSLQPNRILGYIARLIATGHGKQPPALCVHHTPPDSGSDYGAGK